jgi:hypothetical protein
MAKVQFNIRLPDDLSAWLDGYSQAAGKTKTQVVTDLLVALRGNRIFIQPRAGVNAFPANEVYPGESEGFPILVCSEPSGPGDPKEPEGE